jgi:hypothetical protein
MKVQRERYRRVYDEAEKLVRRGSEHSDIIQMIRQPIHHDVMYMGKRHSGPQLVKTGLIDAYGVNSAMSLYLLYREIHRDARDKDIRHAKLRARNKITFPYLSVLAYPREDGRSHRNHAALYGSTWDSG